MTGLGENKLNKFSFRLLFISLCFCVFFSRLEGILDEVRAVYISNMIVATRVKVFVFHRIFCPRIFVIVL